MTLFFDRKTSVHAAIMKYSGTECKCKISASVIRRQRQRLQGDHKQDHSNCPWGSPTHLWRLCTFEVISLSERRGALFCLLRQWIWL